MMSPVLLAFAILGFMLWVVRRTIFLGLSLLSWGGPLGISLLWFCIRLATGGPIAAVRMSLRIWTRIRNWEFNSQSLELDLPLETLGRSATSLRRSRNPRNLSSSAN